MNASSVLHRNVSAAPGMIVRGDGVKVWTIDGQEMLDAVSGGAAVSCLGHGNRRVEDAIRGQLERIAFFHTSFFTSEPAERLADALIRDAPNGLSRVLFCAGGSEATEAALKLARQYWIERGEPSRGKVISRRQSYHGATLGALSVGGNQARREGYAPMLFDVEFIDPCYAYRHQWPGEDVEAYGRRVADQLEAAIERLGPSSVAAFIAEPVVGATLGCVPAVPGYFRRVRDICDRHGVLLILDEVMCGLGRTGERFACAHDGVTPDLLTVAKGLGGGFQPIGAVLVGEKIVAALDNGSGALKHGFTYMAHPVACAAALAVQTVIRDDKLLDAVTARSNELRAGLRAALDGHPFVGDIRGRGLFMGVELVADRARKKPFAPEHAIHARFKKAAMARGLLVYPGAGCVDGRRGDHVLLAPAFTITSGEIARVVDLFAATLGDMERDMFQASPLLPR